MCGNGLGGESKLNWRLLGITVMTMIGLLLIANAQTGKQGSGGPVGRYQLVYGEHVVAGGGGPVKDVFRIDTTTGATDVYLSGKDKSGHFSDLWHRVKD